jgi:limonene-1,2-epoxide hydrolase
VSEPAEVVRALWERFQARSWDAAGELLAEDVVVDWPQTRERMRGRANVIAVNRNYPEGWTIRVLRVLAEGDLASPRSPSITSITAPSMPHRSSRCTTARS